MTDWTTKSDWIVARGNKLYPMCRLCFEPRHDGPCEKSSAMIEYWNARASDADADAARCRGRATEIANLQLAELAQLRAANAELQAEIKELHERAAADNSEITNCLKNIAELVTQRRGMEIELSDVRADLAQAQQYRGKWLAAVNERNEARGQAAQAQAERDAAIEDAHSANAQIEVERNAQRVVWNELRDLFDCKPEESLVAVCNKTIAELATATRRAELSEKHAEKEKAERDAATEKARELQGSITALNNLCNMTAARAALAGPEGGPR